MDCLCIDMWWILICARWFSIIRHCFGLYLLKWLLSNKTVVKRLLFSYGYRAAMPGKKKEKQTLLNGRILFIQTVMKNVALEWVHSVHFLQSLVMVYYTQDRQVSGHCLLSVLQKERTLRVGSGSIHRRNGGEARAEFFDRISIIWHCICLNVSVFVITWSQ